MPKNTINTSPICSNSLKTSNWKHDDCSWADETELPNWQWSIQAVLGINETSETIQRIDSFNSTIHSIIHSFILNLFSALWAWENSPARDPFHNNICFSERVLKNIQTSDRNKRQEFEMAHWTEIQQWGPVIHTKILFVTNLDFHCYVLADTGRKFTHA